MRIRWALPRAHTPSSWWSALALLGVAADLVFNLRYPDYTSSWLRGLLPVALLALAGGQVRWRPHGGWRRWFRISLKFFLVALVFWVLLIAWSYLDGDLDRPPPDRPTVFLDYFLIMCVTAPVLEELVFRFLLCRGLTGILHPWLIVLASGILFGLLHAFYGNLHANNLVAGFLLGWVYLASGSPAVPILWHAFGNLNVLLFWTYWQHHWYG